MVIFEFLTTVTRLQSLFSILKKQSRNFCDEITCQVLKRIGKDKGILSALFKSRSEPMYISFHFSTYSLFFAAGCHLQMGRPLACAIILAKTTINVSFRL